MSSATAPSTLSAVWDIDPVHSGVHFSVKHLMVATVRGEFAKLTGTVDLTGDDLSQARIEAVIDVASISTREPQRDAHLRSADFLDVEKFPAIEFRSTRVERNDDGLDVTGDLTIHGVTRPVSLRVETSNLKRGATATARINRRDFGLSWNVALETGGLLVGDEIKIEIDVELVRRTETA